MTSVEEKSQFITAEQVDVAVDELGAIHFTLVTEGLHFPGAIGREDKDPQETARIAAQGVQRRNEIVDAMVETHLGGLTPGRARLRELAAQAGGIDDQVDGIVRQRTVRSLIVRGTRDSFRGANLGGVETLSDEALFGQLLPSLGLSSVSDKYNDTKTVENLQRSVIAFKLISAKTHGNH